MHRVMLLFGLETTPAQGVPNQTSIKQNRFYFRVKECRKDLNSASFEHPLPNRPLQQLKENLFVSP